MFSLPADPSKFSSYSRQKSKNKKKVIYLLDEVKAQFNSGVGVQPIVVWK